MGWRLRDEAKRYTPAFRLVLGPGIRMVESSVVSLRSSGQQLVRVKALSSYNLPEVPRSLAIEFCVSTLRTLYLKQQTGRSRELPESTIDSSDS